MSKSLNLTLLTLLLAAGSAFAEFEGVLELKTTITDTDGTSLGGGTMNIAIGKAGTRSEVHMQHGPMGINMVVLQKNDTPDKVYSLNEKAKTYTEIDLAQMRAKADQQADKTEYTVQKLGQEKVLGYNTQHVLVKQKNASDEGLKMEMWTAKDFMDYDTYSRLQARRARSASQASLSKALKEAGAEGMPLKSISFGPDGSKSTTEVVKVDKKSLPASTFEIPEGYTKSEGGVMDMMGGLTGPQAEEQRQKMQDAQKRMNEALKNMSPEQRQMIEKMMKQRAGQPQ